MVRTWIDSVRATHAGAGEPVAAVGFPRLGDYFADSTLSVRAVAVTKIPFPPLADWGLLELVDLSRMALSAVTYVDLILVHQSLRTERVHFHELVHTLQWRTLGVDRFLLTYGAGVMQHGYARSPLEAIAYDLQSQFDRGVAIPDLEAIVTSHALETAAAFGELFQSA